MYKNLGRAILCALSLYATNGWADMHIWQDLQAKNPTDNLQQRLLALNETRLGDLLLVASAEPVLSLPLPTGGFVNARLIPVETLAPEIASQYPELKTWRLESTDGSFQSGRAELTTLGLHAMLTANDGDTLFIEPSRINHQAAQRQYRSLSKRDNAQLFKSGASCATTEAIAGSAFTPASLSTATDTLAPTLAERAGESLHTYDIAIAATGEYTAYHGGTKEDALSAVVTTVNRVNEIYQRDLAIKLRLVSDTTTLFTNAATDPYSGDDYSMLSENQGVLDALVGSTNYDLGHVFTTGNGGIAIVEAACNNTYKAQGVSGWDIPEGDTFAIDFFAHELGHQLGATHTFNGTRSSCSGGSRIGSTAYEPGGGSTIMAYAGICSTDNLQTQSDAMFHAGSISQITDYAHNNAGASCASVSSLNNSNPSVNAGSDYTIPANTPFILTGSATDSNNDSLSYSWEQLDAGSASNVDVDTGNNALVRAHLPVSSPSRTVPRLSDLFNATHTLGETLPSTTRSMNFRLQVRDGKGGTGYDDMRLNVTKTSGAFAITAPTNTVLTAGSSLPVSWNVADTDQAPVNCSKVDIAISNNGSESFQTLVSNTANDGTETVTLPATLGARSNIRVKCSNNIFFALSAVNAKSGETGSGSSGTTTSTTTDSGGGGSMPLDIVLLGGLLALARRYFKVEKIDKP